MRAVFTFYEANAAWLSYYSLPTFPTLSGGFGTFSSSPSASGFLGPDRSGWVLVPIYGFVVVWRTVGDLVDKERELTGRASTSAKVTWWYIAGSSGGGSGRNLSGWVALVLLVVTVAFIAIFGFKVQTSANNYLRAKYPGSTLRGWTTGEVIAIVLGIIFLPLGIVGAFLPSS